MQHCMSLTHFDIRFNKADISDIDPSAGAEMPSIIMERCMTEHPINSLLHQSCSILSVVRSWIAQNKFLCGWMNVERAYNYGGSVNL